MRPILKWAGGKSRQALAISDAFGGRCRGTYYEPFVGSGAVFLYRRALGQVDRAVLTDVNPKLVEVHRAVRDDVDAVLRALDALPKEDWRERFYEVRDAYNAGPWEGPAHAARFVWLNRAGFNGLYRENRHGHYNVPVGSYARLALPTPERFRAIAALFEGVRIDVADFRDVLGEAGPRDQVYCDPPYVPLSATASFTRYSSESFGFQEQLDLAEAAQDAAGRGAHVLLSNHDTPVVRRLLYPTSRSFRVVGGGRVCRAISRKAESRKGVEEALFAIGPLDLPAVG